MTACIAVLNAGSSSIKFAVYAADLEDALLHGQIEGIGATPRLVMAGGISRDLPADTSHEDATRIILAREEDLPPGNILAAAGHRIVHGGMTHAAPLLVTPTLLAELEALTPLAPLHQPYNLAPIRALTEHAPHLPQVACFDTAFHRGQAAVARNYALPQRFTDEGVQAYGFHGLSYEYVTGALRDRAPDLAAGRVIIAHLGNGASLCAVRDGKSVATTMGFTALEGLVMGTRCGRLDPGILLYLMRQHRMDAAAIEDLLYRHSGLLGVSGISGDMRALRKSSASAARAAIDLFVYRIVREIGSLVAALGGLDGLVFTAGIGEHDAATRAEISAGCSWLGLHLDPALNQAGVGRVSGPDSKIACWVVPTDEEKMICRHTRKVAGL